MDEQSKVLMNGAFNMMHDNETTRQLEIKDRKEERVYKKKRDNKILAAFAILCIAWLISDIYKTHKMYDYSGFNIVNESKSESHSSSEKGGE